MPKSLPIALPITLRMYRRLASGLVPANIIINKAQEGKFDRIIMGSTGINALEKVVMGSTAAKVVAHAPCEVTIVR